MGIVFYLGLVGGALVGAIALTKILKGVKLI
jgi:hypothetical protein